MDRLGNPERRLRFIHVAGTKGKGSVCAFAARILEEAGYRVGLYISPSLVNVGERISINGELIPPADLIAVFEEVWQAIQGMPPEDPITVFEVFTAMALVYFARKQVDVVVWEVGLGGKYDATNVIPVPEVAVITNIGLEHTDRLGNTVEEIAVQKAGIIKEGGTTIISAQDYPAAQATLLAQAELMHNRIALAGRDFTFSAETYTPDAACFDYHSTAFGHALDLPQITISLRGIHQVQNAAGAIAAVTALADRDGLHIPEDVLRRALQQTFWPGRMELVPGSPVTLLDGAHTQTAANYLVRSLHAHFPGQRFTMLFGVLKDKNMDGIAGMLAPAIDTVVLTRVPDTTRAASPWELEEKFLHFHPHGSIVVEEDFHEALQRARALTPKDSWLLVTGSLYLVGAVRKAMGLYTFTRP